MDTECLICYGDSGRYKNSVGKPKGSKVKPNHFNTKMHYNSLAKLLRPVIEQKLLDLDIIPVNNNRPCFIKCDNDWCEFILRNNNPYRRYCLRCWAHNANANVGLQLSTEFLKLQLKSVRIKCLDC